MTETGPKEQHTIQEIQSKCLDPLNKYKIYFAEFPLSTTNFLTNFLPN